jgi:hypothetical protein
MSKLGMLAAGAVGYVLGARAGRERYDQIVRQAQRLWANPKVQQAATGVQERAKEAVPVVAVKVGDAAKHAAGAAVSAVKRDGGDHESASGTRAEGKGGDRSARNGGPETKVSHL